MHMVVFICLNLKKTQKTRKIKTTKALTQTQSQKHKHNTKHDTAQYHIITHTKLHFTYITSHTIQRT